MPVLHMTDATLRALAKDPPAKPTQLDWYDDHTKSGVRGLLIKQSYGGSMTWFLLHYPRKGKSAQHKLGRYPALKLAQARIEALDLQSKLRADPLHLQKRETEAFEAVVKKYDQFYLTKNKLRTAKVIRGNIKKHLMPTLRDWDFNSIRRRDIAHLLDTVEQSNGAPMADAVLAVFRSISNWYATRDEDYLSPIGKGMRRYRSRPRERVLNDDEIKALWKATVTMGTFGAFVRICLLTGQRKSKIAEMKWTDLNAGVWTIATELNEKPNCGIVKLTPFAMSIIEAQPRLEGNAFVFPATRGRGPLNAFGQHVLELRTAMRAIIPDMPAHTLHDLRRTFRTRLSQLNVAPHIAERAMGHLVGSPVERTYDRHAYGDEIGNAFAAVSRHVQALVSDRPANVIPLRGSGQGRGGARRRIKTPA